MKEKILEVIRKYNLIESGDKLVLGVSGGPDSMCMLDILNDIKNDKNLNLKFDIVVAHVNHMIREEADRDEQYVKEYCEKNNIEFYSRSIDVQKIGNNMKIGTEEAGRKVRYEFFDEILEKTDSNKVAIAHNKNDKIETILMNLFRGSGVLGLKGIDIKNGKYIRPLLECERNEIEEYCLKNNLNPRIDKTNFDNKYTRNKIRNIVIPYIKKEFNPNIINTIDRLSILVSEEEEYINKQIIKVYNEILLREDLDENIIILDLKKFNYQEKVIKSKLILYTITRIFGDSKGIEKVHIEDIIKLCGRNVGNKYLTPNKNTKILVNNGKIYFFRQK